ncbi:MAG: Asp-tRNA(Asn)/Glu-tRNA(Gln) amidotransferase subunit GatB [Thermodesulfobacteriota bacterium]
MQYEVVIGLEVHAHLLTRSKIFCGCSTKFGAEPNSQVCPVCIGMPGVLPVLNKRAVEYAIRMAIATNCNIENRSVFARKNYFYPDLPKGYQISQYELPLATNGYMEIEVDGEKKRLGITRIHMEEDAGKLLHKGTIDTAGNSYVDLNRTGMPLIEIVSEPDMRSPDEAVAYLKAVRDILVYLDICDGNMEEGSFRCDANVSLRPVGRKKFGTKAEVKNMNSFRFIHKALGYEINRQTEVLEEGGKVVQETRLWDASKGITMSMRGKEEAHDYRYFPEPDLLSLEIDDDWTDDIRKSLPELPGEKRERFIKEYGLTSYDASVLTASKNLADFYEESVRLYPKYKAVSNWVMGELQKELNKGNIEIVDCPVTPENLASLIKMIDNGVISGKIAKGVFEEMYGTGKSPKDIVKEKGLTQITDDDSIKGVIKEVLEANPDQVGQFREGKETLLGFFVGQVMKKTSGKANPKKVNQLLRELLRGAP